MRSWVVVVAAGIAGAARMAAAGPLDKAPFTATPAELLAEARALPKSDTDVVVLENDVTMAFDADGRADVRCHRIFLVRTPQGAEDWRKLGIDYRPTLDDVPVFRARAIAPSGAVTQLDPSPPATKPEVETPAGASERREASVQLPAMAPGVLIEQEVATHGREPRLRRASSDRFYVGLSVPIHRSRIVVTAPATARVAFLDLPGAPPLRATPHGASTTWDATLGPLAARPDREPMAPDDFSPEPVIAVSIAPSYPVIAAAYAGVVDARIAAGPPPRLPALLGVPPREAIARATAWLHEEVADPGVGFDNAAPVPATPADTIAARTGDAAARAITLVALLRGAGIAADVALLSSAGGPDVHAALPAFDEFDYAVVRAKVDGADVWIDPGDRYTPAGALSTDAQGRFALVAARDTTGLVKLPVVADDTLRKRRTFTFTEDGAATYHQIDEGIGASDAALRHRYGGSRAETQKLYASGLAARFGVTHVSVATTDATDLARPFVITADGVMPPQSARRELVVEVSPGAVLADLPDALDPDDDTEPAPRRMPFQWRHQRVVEVETSLVFPPGFSPPPLVAHDARDIGAMRLETDRRVEGNAIVVRYRLSPGKRVLTADEAMATRKAIAALRVEPDERIAARVTAWALWDERKPLEAIAEAKRTIALHPKEARHWDTLAELYAEAGMGLAARRAAKQGVAVEPKSAAAHVTLGRMLHRTAAGILAVDSPEADSAGALAEFRKAIALDPSDDEALADAALAIGHELGGGSAAVLREAAAFQARAIAISSSPEREEVQVHLLLAAGQFAEAEAAARALPASITARDSLIVAAVGARDPSAAPAAAASLVDPAQRQRLLRDAGRELAMRRLYDQARAIFLPAVDASTDPLSVELMKRVKPIDIAALDPKDPSTPALRALLAETGFGPAGTPPWDDPLTGDLANLRAQAAASLARFHLLARPVAIDMAIATTTMTVDGDAASGWRIILDAHGSKSSFYVVADRGAARLVGLGEDPTGAGPLIASLLAKGDTADALRWVDGVAEDLARAKGPDHEFGAAWQKVRASGVPTREALELFAVLIQAHRLPASAIPMLRRCPIADPYFQETCIWDLLSALSRAGRLAEAVDAAVALSDLYPDSVLYTNKRVEALSRAGRGADAAAVLDAALAKTPSEPRLLFARARVEVDRHDVAAADAWFDKLAARPGASQEEVNNAAWGHLMWDGDPAAARAAAKPLLAQSRLSGNAWNTIGTLEAMSDRPREAWDAARKGFSLPDEPRPYDYFILGRIAETYGLRDDAIAYYRRCPKVLRYARASEADIPMLAQKRLAALGAR